MSRTRDDLEELGQRIDKVNDLWDEEEKERFREVSKDSNCCEDHATPVAERITDEYLRRIPVEVVQRKCREDIRQNYVNTHLMHVLPIRFQPQLNHIVNQNAASNYQTLSHF